MPRTDTQFDGMLRHLGAAYYDSLHGRASQADVTRAVDNVAGQLDEQARPAASSVADASQRVVHERRTGQDAGVHGWSRRVGDVMATSVVTVDRATPYKEIARLQRGPRSGPCLWQPSPGTTGLVKAGSPRENDIPLRVVLSGNSPVTVAAGLPGRPRCCRPIE